MRARLAIAAALLITAGCSDKPGEKGPKASAGSQTASAAPSQPPSAAPSKAPTLPKAPEVVPDADWARLFAGDKPALPAPVAALQFGQPRTKLAETFGAKLAADGKLNLPEMAELPVRLGFHTGSETLRFVQLTVPKNAVAPLMKRWGQPTKAKVSAGRDGLWWLGDGVQAIFETRAPRHYLTFWPLTSWKALVGDTKGKPGFQREVPLLGGDGAAIAKAYLDAQPRAKKGQLDLHLAPHERQPRPTRARLSLDDAGKVTAVSLTLTYGRQAAMRDAVLAHLTQVYGKAKTAGDVHTFPGLTVSDRTQIGRLVLTWRAGK